MRLIDADVLWMDVIHAMDYCDDILEIIEKSPTIEPERKTGHWIDGKLEWHGIVERYCSECGQRLTSEKTVRMKFCPNCGAKMEEGEQE